jgi:hypothetical protein
MMDAVSAPNSVNYGDQFPLGIEAKSQKRLFFLLPVIHMDRLVITLLV